ncbi:MAG: LytTR family DNA-binding domain-containing protein [Bacteroidota bacterium]
MQVLIIEDEVRAANQLQNLLIELEINFQLLGIIDSVADSIAWLQSHKAPDLVFMDIQLADGLSFEIFQHVSLVCPVIFTTAFDQYAIRAFKVNSIDYLLKPIQKKDLQQAITKYEHAQRPLKLQEAALQLLSDLQQGTSRQGILVKQGTGFERLQIRELLYAYSEDSVTFGVTATKRFIIDETIDQLAPTLDSSQFFRINRGQIVAKEAILKIERYFNHRLKLSVTNSKTQEFIVSRPKTKEFKDWLNR